MKRAVFCVLLVISAGCVGNIPTTGSDNGNSSADNAPPYPEKPAQLTRDTVTTYATQYQRAAEYRAVKEPGAEIELSCNSTVIAETTASFYVVAGCATTIRKGGGVGTGGPGHGQLYFINNTTTVRMTPRNAKAPSVNTNISDIAGFRPEFYYSNFDSDSHTLTTTITYLGVTPPDQVTSFTATVGSKQGIRQDEIVLKPGTYRVTVQLDDGITKTYRWGVDERSTNETNSLSIYITPDGDLNITNRPWIRL